MENSSPTPARIVAAFLVALLSPPLAWLVWVPWSNGSASDAVNIAWFVTVAVGCVVAGALAGEHVRRLWLALVAILSTVATLWLWWSSEDESGLFVIGIIVATPLVAVASVPLLMVGGALASRGRPGRT